MTVVEAPRSASRTTKKKKKNKNGDRPKFLGNNRPLLERENPRVIGIVYPKKHPRYQRLIERFPPSGHQPVLKQLLVRGWREACRVTEAYLRKDAAWLSQWRVDHGFPPMTTTDESGALITELPIPDLNRIPDDRKRYNIYMKRDNDEHREILQYYEHLPTGEVRQIFVRLALLLASEDPDIDSITAALM